MTDDAQADSGQASKPDAPADELSARLAALDTPPEGKQQEDTTKTPKDDAKDAPDPDKDGKAPERLTRKRMEALKAAGYTDDDIEAMGDKAAIVGDKLAKQRSDVSRVMSEKGNLEARIKELEKALQSKGNPDGKAKGDSDPDADGDDFNPDDDWDTMLTKLKALRAELKGAKDQLTKQERERTERETHEINQAAESFFDDLDDELFPELAEDGKARAEVLKYATTEKAKGMTWDKALEIGLGRYNPEKFAQMRLAQEREAVTKRRRGTVETPNGRQRVSDSKLTPQEAKARAADELQSQLEKAGL